MYSRGRCQTLFYLGLVILLFVPIVSADTSDNFDIVVGALGPPHNFVLSITPNADVKIMWDKETSADTTYICRKLDSYPTSRTDGTLIYNSTGSLFVDGDVTIGNTYYYRAWSYNTTYNIWSNYVSAYIYVAQPDLFDIRNIVILDSITTDLSIICSVCNNGALDADMVITWVLTRVDTGILLDSGGDTFLVEAGENTSYHITPSTSYVGLCRIYFSGNNASASATFITTASAGGGGGGGGGASHGMDSDGDGLTDAEEQYYGTDPYDVDTDNDGYTDYVEIQSGTDPLDPNSYPGSKKMGFTFFAFLIALSLIALLLFLFVFLWKKDDQRDFP